MTPKQFRKFCTWTIGYLILVRNITYKAHFLIQSILLFQYGSSSAVNTVLTFAERKSPEEVDCSQDTQVALAQLYAHVQSMPESAKKKKLLKQFNRAGNMHNHTPKKGKHSRSRTFGESIKVNIGTIAFLLLKVLLIIYIFFIIM